MFSYTYSAKQQEEVRRIRQKYIPPEENKMEQLRRLDQSAAKKGTRAAVVTGVIGCLLLGLGMSCTMEWTEYFIPGVVIGAVGIGVIIAAHPIYTYITKKQRQKLAPEILRLTEELLGGE